MSEPWMPKPLQSFQGAVMVARHAPVGMITLRGDLDAAEMAAAVKGAVGLAMPAQRRIRSGKRGAVAWMSPDELLLFMDHDRAPVAVDRLDKALAGGHHLAVDVSDARALFTLAGHGVREVIAKGSPADMAPDALPVGEFRRSRIGQVAAAWWLSDAQTLHLVCFRSVGDYMFDWLCVAAARDGLPGFLAV
ncbi:MAG: sarcosine oxidase subunit gamma family protein [Paracoccaceae bacterium]|nr:sarcosine oxidase subunit gamma family protein [Paracoccaceae bacterium]